MSVTPKTHHAVGKVDDDGYNKYEPLEARKDGKSMIYIER